MTRRLKVVLAALAVAATCLSQESSQAWPKSAQVEPSVLAELLRSGAKAPVILCVAPQTLYRAKHLPNAVFAGQGSKPEGIEILKKAVANIPKDREIVIYCGCCPLTFCPNLRPAYKELTAQGYTNVRILHIPTNMNADWYSKDYPIETAAAPAK